MECYKNIQYVSKITLSVCGSAVNARNFQFIKKSFSVFQVNPLLNVLKRQYSNAVPTTKLFIDGQFVESKTTQWVDLHDPATNNLVTKVPQSTQAGKIMSFISASVY